MPQIIPFDIEGEWLKIFQNDEKYGMKDKLTNFKVIQYPPLSHANLPFLYVKMSEGEFASDRQERGKSFLTNSNIRMHHFIGAAKTQKFQYGGKSYVVQTDKYTDNENNLIALLATWVDKIVYDNRRRNASKTGGNYSWNVVAMEFGSFDAMFGNEQLVGMDIVYTIEVEVENL